MDIIGLTRMHSSIRTARFTKKIRYVKQDADPGSKEMKHSTPHGSIVICISRSREKTRRFIEVFSKLGNMAGFNSWAHSTGLTTEKFVSI